MTLVNLMSDFRFMPSWYWHCITQWLLIQFPYWKDISKYLTHSLFFQLGIPYSLFCRVVQRPQNWDMRFEDVTAEPIVVYNRTAQASHFVKPNLSSDSMMWTLELPDRVGSLSQGTVNYRIQDACASLSSRLYLQCSEAVDRTLTVNL